MTHTPEDHTQLNGMSKCKCNHYRAPIGVRPRPEWAGLARNKPIKLQDRKSSGLQGGEGGEKKEYKKGSQEQGKQTFLGSEKGEVDITMDAARTFQRIMVSVEV